jgi:glycosyltransferase involved in cell wall biosynthesis
MNQDENFYLVCNEIIDWIDEYLEDTQLKNIEKVSLNRTIKDYIFNVNSKNKFECLETLSEVINAFINGEVSDVVFRFYFEKQCNIASDKLDKIIKNLKSIKVLPKSINISFPDNFYFPKVSVIITTFNRKHYLDQAINSILLQDYPNIEIIVIDDCSTDGTNLFMINRYSNEPRITYVRNDKNSGPGNNRREAFKNYSSGDYVLYLDDDDYLIDINYISKAVQFHINHPTVSYVSANVFLDYSDKNKLSISKLKLSEIMNKNEYFINFEKEGYPKPVSTLTTVFKRESLLEMDLLNMNMVNDASIYLRILLVGDAGFINTIAGIYRIHGNNITFNLSPEFLIENLNEKLVIKNKAINNYGYDIKEMEEWFNNNAYNTIAYFLYNSAKKYADYKYMTSWVQKNCPNIYIKIKKEFRMLLFKRELLRVALIRKILLR